MHHSHQCWANGIRMRYHPGDHRHLVELLAQAQRGNLPPSPRTWQGSLEIDTDWHLRATATMDC
eukprot:12210989-Heterocapsa_arctica.AAC.1